jgi:Ferritin-like domain
MSDPWTLEEVDVDGAIQEAAEKVDGGTRLAFLKKAGIGAGAVMMGGGVAAALPSLARAGTPSSDVAILNFALTLEYLEAAFYAEAVKYAGKFDAKTAHFARVVAKHEAAHVAFLKSALGAAAVKSPKFNFKGSNHAMASFQATSQVLEDTGVAAYSGQGGAIKTKAILGAAVSILTVEARHASWMRTLRGIDGAPIGFDKSQTKAQILTAVKGTGFIVG